MEPLDGSGKEVLREWYEMVRIETHPRQWTTKRQRNLERFNTRRRIRRRAELAKRKGRR